MLSEKKRLQERIKFLEGQLRREKDSEEKDNKEIGQWQNRVYQIQMQLDAQRQANMNAIEMIKDIYSQEKGDFVNYNSHWKKQIKQLTCIIKGLQDKIINIESEVNLMSFKLENLEKKG